MIHGQHSIQQIERRAEELYKMKYFKHRGEQGKEVIIAKSRFVVASLPFLFHLPGPLQVLSVPHKHPVRTQLLAQGLLLPGPT